MPPRKRYTYEIKNLEEPFFSDSQKKNFSLAIEDFNSELYFEAHELWEDVWLEMGNSKKDDSEIIIRALVQFAAALYCVKQERSGCACKNLEKSVKKFSMAPAKLLGMDINKVYKNLKENIGSPEKLYGYKLNYSG